jgi:hypothetical protein
MFTAHDPRVVYDAIVTQLASSTGKNIGESQAPSNTTAPYAVVYPQDETDTDTTLADPHDVTVFEWLVVSVGDSQDQALWMQQKVRAALLGWQPVVAGYSFGFVLRDGGGGVQREDPVQPPRFSVADRFVVLAD